MSARPCASAHREGRGLPRDSRRAEKLRATIYFADKSGIRSEYRTDATWAPLGQTPLPQAKGWCFSLNMISAVSTQGEFPFMLHQDSVGAKVFAEFLRHLIANAENPLFLIVDGHPIHKAQIINSYDEGLDDRLKLFYLPPFSPHLNPDAMVWTHVKPKALRHLVESAE